MLVRQVLFQIISLVGSVALARILGPRQFGLFAIVYVVVVLIGFFGDFGLAPSFIQRRDEVTHRDLQVAFTLQQILVTALVAIAFVAAPWISAAFGSSYPNLTWLIRALAFSLYLTSWRSISALQLERGLVYKRIAWIEVAEILTYQVVAIALAVEGAGTWSLVAAVLASGLLGTGLMYLAAPWPVRLAFDRRRAREMLVYGLPFQLQLVLRYGGVLAPLMIVAGMIGPTAVGYVSWAQNYGNKPQDLIWQVMRVGFSHVARIQDDGARVEEAIVRYLSFMLLVSGLWFAGLLAAGPDLVPSIFTSKWTPAVGPLALYGLAVNFTVLSAVGAVTLNGLGQVNAATRAVVIRSVVNIGLALLLGWRFGINGVASAWVLAALLEAVLIYLVFGVAAARRIFAPLRWTLLPVSAATAVGLVIRHVAAKDLRGGVVAVAVIAVYAVVTRVAAPAWMRKAAGERLAGSRLWPWGHAAVAAGDAEHV